MTDITAPRPRSYRVVCANCNSQFDGYSRKAQYCSPECKKAFRVGYLKRYHEARPGYQQQLSRAYYEANADKLRRASAAWYMQNTERAKAAQRDYAARNTESLRAKQRVWAAANPDKVAASRRRSKSKITPAMFAEQYHRRRARKASNGVYLVTEKDMRRCLARFNNSCAYCSTSFTSSNRPTWDHVIAIARGGQHSIGNMVPACPACNTSKWASTVTEWRKRLSSQPSNKAL
jgi:5-methylcytosine-specific restriction endonuclease McrA